MRRELKNAHSEKGHGPAPQEMFLLRGEEQPLEHSSTQGGKAETLRLFTRGLQTLLLQKTPKSQLRGQRPAGGACTTTPSCRAHPVPTGDGSTGWAPHVLGVALPTRVTARRDAVPPATPVEAGAEAQPGVHPEARPHPTPSPAPGEAGTPGRSGEGGRKDASPASTEEERERLQEAGARPSPRQRSLEENREREKGQARREAQLPAPRGAPRRPLPTAGRRGSCRLSRGPGGGPCPAPRPPPYRAPSRCSRRRSSRSGGRGMLGRALFIAAGSAAARLWGAAPRRTRCCTGPAPGPGPRSAARGPPVPPVPGLPAGLSAGRSGAAPPRWAGGGGQRELSGEEDEVVLFFFFPLRSAIRRGVGRSITPLRMVTLKGFVLLASINSRRDGFARQEILCFLFPLTVIKIPRNKTSVNVFGTSTEVWSGKLCPKCVLGQAGVRLEGQESCVLGV